MTNIKAGRSIAPNLEDRDWKSAAKWAFAHANHSEDTLAEELYALEDVIIAFETKKQLVSDGHKLTKVSVPVMGNYVEVSAEMSPRAGRRSKKSSGESSSKQDKGKARLPLGQRLDKLRADKTDSFLHEVTKGQGLRRAPLVLPVGKSGGGGHVNIHPTAARSRTGMESRPGSSLGGRKSRPETAEGDGGGGLSPVPSMGASLRGASVRFAQTGSKDLGSTAGFTAAPPGTGPHDPKGRSKALAFKRSGSVAVRSPSISPVRDRSATTAFVAAVAEASGNDMATHGLIPTLSEGAEEDNLSEPSLRAERRPGVDEESSAVVSPRGGRISRVKSAGPTQYSNIPSGVGATAAVVGGFSDGSGDGLDVSEETKKCLKRYQYMFDEASGNMARLNDGYGAKMEEVGVSGDDLLERWEHFGATKAFQQEYLLYIIDHKEFLFPDEMLHNLQCLECESNNLQVDLKNMKRRARSKLQLKGIQNIMKYRFVITSIGKLHDYFKKTKQIVPLCCFRFLSVLKNVLMLGFEFTSEMYYYIMEGSMRNPVEEHAALLIYETLKAARDVIGVPAEEFLAYLKDHGYQECPKLLELVRTNKEKRHRELFMERTKGISINTGTDPAAPAGPVTGPAAMVGVAAGLMSAPGTMVHKAQSGPPAPGAFSKASSAHNMDADASNSSTGVDTGAAEMRGAYDTVHVTLGKNKPAGNA